MNMSKCFQVLIFMLRRIYPDSLNVWSYAFQYVSILVLRDMNIPEKSTKIIYLPFSWINLKIDFLIII